MSCLNEEDKWINDIFLNLEKFISLIIPIKDEPDRGLMANGIMLSIIKGRFIHLIGLSQTRKSMQDRLCLIAIKNFPKFLKNNMVLPSYMSDSIYSIFNTSRFQGD